MQSLGAVVGSSTTLAVFLTVGTGTPNPLPPRITRYPALDVSHGDLTERGQGGSGGVTGGGNFGGGLAARSGELHNGGGLLDGRSKDGADASDWHSLLQGLNNEAQ